MKLHIYAVAATLALAMWSCGGAGQSASTDADSTASPIAEEQADAQEDIHSITDEDAAAEQAAEVLADASEDAVEKAVETVKATVKEKTPVGGDVKDLTNDDLLRPGAKVKKVTILDFNATWCVPCKKFTPIFHEVAKQFGGSMDFYAVDVDENPNTAEAFGVQSIPMVVIMRPDGTSRKFVGLGDIYPGDKFLELVKSEFK